MKQITIINLAFVGWGRGEKTKGQGMSSSPQDEEKTDCSVMRKKIEQRRREEEEDGN